MVSLGLFYFFIRNLGATAAGRATVEIGNAVFKVEVASTDAQKALGLSGRSSLLESQGMLFTFDEPGAYGFWMKDMKFPIDIIWIKGGAIAGFAENAEPQAVTSTWNLKIYYPPQPIGKVLEVNAGDVARDNISVGEPVLISQ